jgi:pyruvate dehydrogenase E1 component alpha subunit
MKEVKYPYRGKGIDGLVSGLSRLDRSFAQKLYYEMLRIRRIEEVIAERYSQDEMKSPIHLAIGQEAVAVGSCAAFQASDLVFCGHRTHAVYFAKGGDLKGMLSELHCRSNGCCGSRGGSMHLLDKSVGMMGSSAIVAGIIPIATGAALAMQMRGEKRATTVYLGDAAVEEGACWESINFARLKRLPILYLCENNYYSVCSPLDVRQPQGVTIAQKARGFGLETFDIDGNDVVQVFETTQRALHILQQGLGPVFIEAHTYRYRGHHGPVDDTKSGYRTADELAEWMAVDPVALFEAALHRQGLLSAARKNEMLVAINREVDEAFQHALASPFPAESDLMTHVYSE